jgi:hypothetical protein
MRARIRRASSGYRLAVSTNFAADLVPDGISLVGLALAEASGIVKIANTGRRA